MADEILMRLILDTGVLFHPAALRAIAQYREPIILPAIAYAERIRQLRAAGRSTADFDTFLSKSNIVVEAFDRGSAQRVPAIGQELWNKASRDVLIATHVHDDDLLWTTNPRDFRSVGVPEERLVPVPAPV